MKVTIIQIMIGAFGTVTKGLLKRLEDLEVGGWVETIQTTDLLKMARILRRVLETWGDLLSLKLQWKRSANADVKNPKGVNNNGIWHWKMCHAYNEKWEKRNNRRNRITISGKNQNIWRKKKLQVLGNNGCKCHPRSKDERKNNELEMINKKKRTYHQMDFAIPAEDREKIKERTCKTNTKTLLED